MEPVVLMPAVLAGIDEDASGSSGPSDQEQLNGIVSKLNSLPGQETKMIAKLASQLGEVLASPSGSEAMGPECRRGSWRVTRPWKKQIMKD